jgi:hypothetical protein
MRRSIDAIHLGLHHSFHVLCSLCSSLIRHYRSRNPFCPWILIDPTSSRSITHRMSFLQAMIVTRSISLLCLMAALGGYYHTIALWLFPREGSKM